jgi:hypothetical protein
VVQELGTSSTYDDIRDSHELQSLAEVPFEASTSATTPYVSTMARSNPWQPRMAGLAFRDLNGAGVPESTPVRRLSQAKTILRERFTASIRNDAGSTQELRLIIQTLYLYQALPPGVIDGLMFAFAMGTDPEVRVILEARSVGDSAARYYAVAPCTSAFAKCSIDQTEVWTSENQVANGTFRMYMNKP